jgi:putative hydrolase of the HAD superfamily
MAWRAVIFDLGGVVLGSPLRAIERFEAETGLAPGTVSRVVVASGPSGAWSRLERGELDVAAFCALFEAECQAAGFRVSASTLMERIGAAGEPRPAMLEAIRRLRAEGLLVSALTNNWVGEHDGTRALRPHFDVFVESCALGLRKPDPRIYLHACELLGVAPPEAVFLDDIGQNLKSARALGMATIKVDEPEPALDELGALLGIPLREA